MSEIKNISDAMSDSGISMQSLAGRTPKHNNPHSAEHVMTQQDITLINGLFGELKVIFPAWRTAFLTADDYKRAKRSWSKALVENGINRVEQIQNGLRKARQHDSDFLPSSGKFISWCLSAGSDVYPSPQEAFQMFPLYRFKDTRIQLPEVVQAAFAQIGKRTMQTSTEKALWELFEHNYAVVCRRAAGGEDIAELIPKALPKTVNKILTNEEKEAQRLSVLESVRARRKELFKRG